MSLNRMKSDIKTPSMVIEKEKSFPTWNYAVGIWGENSVATKRAHDIKQMERNHLIQ